MDRLIVDGIDLTEFLGIPYVASRHPGRVSVENFLKNLQKGSNCQLLTLGILAKAGLYTPNCINAGRGKRVGSKELWLDTGLTYQIVMRLSGNENVLRDVYLRDGKFLWAFDILFFSPPGADPDADPYNYQNLHLGIYIGSFGENKHCILHNTKPGPSTIWPVWDFHKKGYTLFGIKRSKLS